MAEHKYTVASEEGAEFAGRGRALDAEPLQVGDTVKLDLDVETKRAVLAAGWLELADSKGGES